MSPLEEIPVIIPQVINTEFLLKNQPKYEYTPSDETYFASENFATVDNIFAEEICLGSGIKIKDEIIPINFKYFELKKYFEKPDENQNTPEPQTEFDSEVKSSSLEMPQTEAADVEKTCVSEVPQTEFPDEDEICSPETPQIELDSEVKSSSPETSQTVETQSEIEELSEEVPLPKESTYYSMTNFAENLTDETPILDAADIPENAIIEEDGVFSISQIKDYEKMGQDKDFKSLVDSIL